MEMLLNLVDYLLIESIRFDLLMLVGYLVTFVTMFVLIYHYGLVIIKTIKKVYILDQMSGFHLKTSPYNHQRWLFGHPRMYQPTHDGVAKAMKRSLDFPGIFNFHISPAFTFLQLYHPETVLPILSSSEPKNKLIYGYLQPWLGQGLLTSNGQHWHRHRRLITPAFHFTILKSYISTFNDCAVTMLDKFDGMKDEPIEVFEHVGLLTLDTMLKCAMSSHTNVQITKGQHSYITAIHTLTEIVVRRILSPLLISDWLFYFSSHGRHFRKALSVVHAHTEKVIADRRKALENSETSNLSETNCHHKKLRDFIDILLDAKDENGVRMTNKEIQEEVDTFLFEGHDTTSSGISWALYNLAKHPEYQEKCREEVIKVVGHKKHIEWSDIAKLEYLTMFIKESLRMYPPVPDIGRIVTDSLPVDSQCNHSGADIPSGTNIIVSFIALHRNPHVWPNPNEFIPERFTKENIAKRSPHAFLPFSAGSRNCIGKQFAMNELKVVLGQVLRRFILTLNVACPEPQLQPHIILQSANGIKIKFDPLE